MITKFSVVYTLFVAIIVSAVVLIIQFPYTNWAIWYFITVPCVELLLIVWWIGFAPDKWSNWLYGIDE